MKTAYHIYTVKNMKISMVCVYVKGIQAFNVVIVVLLMLLFIKHLSTCLVSCVKFRTAFKLYFKAVLLL